MSCVPRQKVVPRPPPPKKKAYARDERVKVVPFSALYLWADPGVLWKKAPRAMRAMRGKTLETAPFQPHFECTKSFLKVLSN